MDTQPQAQPMNFLMKVASLSPDSESPSMFLQKGDGKCVQDQTSPSPGNSKALVPAKPEVPAEVITVKDFFDFMKISYQVFEHLEGGDESDGAKINWDELTKLTVLNHVIDQGERDLLCQTTVTEARPSISKSESALGMRNSEDNRLAKRYSCSQIEGPSDLRGILVPEANVEMLGVWTEANLNCKLNDVINEGILDSIIPYLVGYKKLSKTTSLYTPIIKGPSTTSVNDSNEMKKQASFGGFVPEKESKDRLGRRKSSVIANQEKSKQKQEGEVEIHVCDEVKGMKKDFRCSQKLLVSKMGYFADVTAGQRLEDMDISVHCDIMIFDWLMRWVKRDTILVADWPLLDPQNVVPILVSASFLQMEPLLHDCLIYCHAHMSEIVKTNTNLACLSDALLNRLAAMYTNTELEALRDRKDKLQSRLYCRLIISLGEPEPETLRGHYATLATMFKCSKCNKLLSRHIAQQVPCLSSSMLVDRRGNVISHHTRDTGWSLNEYITWLYGELRSWRRVYWRLWADCHFLRCQLCDTHFPAYQMEWCSHHSQPAHMFALDGRPPLPAGRYPCCGERAYRFETVPRNTGCQFREHLPDEQLPRDAAVMEIYLKFREIIAMPPPQLVFPERRTRLVARDTDEELSGRLQCKEVFWWEGIQLMPPRPTLGLLGKLYTSDNKFNPQARPGSPPSAPRSTVSVASASSPPELKKPPVTSPKKGTLGGGGGGGDDSAGEEQSSGDESERSEASAHSDEDAPAPPPQRPARNNKRTRVSGGRVWSATLSARSNQDGQRRYEERAARSMRQALGKRLAAQLAAQPAAGKPRSLPGGVYARLESEWRERHGARRGAHTPHSQRTKTPYKFK